MWNREVRSFDYTVRIEENIYIDQSRSPAVGGPPPNLLLNALHQLEKLRRVQPRRRRQSQIQEARLMDDANRLRLVPGGNSLDLKLLLQRRDGSPQVLLPISQIAPK